jgi:hypothetical protein
MSSETIDPLDLLREFIIGSQRSSQNQVQQNDQRRITVKEGLLCFESSESGTLKLPLITDTAWKFKNCKGFYNLGSLYCCIVYKDNKLSDYMRTCNELGVKIIQILEKEEVINYFTGLRPSTEMIDI